MIMTLIVLGVIIPAFMWLLLYCKITDQYTTTEDGELIMTETKAEAQQHVLSRTVRSIFFWIYTAYAVSCIIAGVVSVNAFYLGDWYFSL